MYTVIYLLLLGLCMGTCYGSMARRISRMHACMLLSRLDLDS